MIVYLDLVLIATIITDYTILKTINQVWKEKIVIYRFIIALLFSVGNVLLFIFPFKHLMILRYFLGIIIVLIAYPFKSIKDIFIKIIIYYLLNIAFIGVIVIFKVNNFLMLGVSLLFVVVSWIIENYKGVVINENNNIYKIEIGNTLLKAYLDTGNTAYFDGIPVIFINDKIKNSLDLTEIGIMKVQGINGQTNITIYDGLPIKINNKKVIVKFAIINIDKYDVLLHRDCI